MKVGLDRKCTGALRDVVVKQVIDGGRSMSAVVRSLEISSKTPANWVYRACNGLALVKRKPAQPASELKAEVSRLRQENARLRVEKKILRRAAYFCLASRCEVRLDRRTLAD